MSVPPIVTQYGGPTPYKLTNFVTGNDVFTSDFPNLIDNLAVWLDGKDILGNGSLLNNEDPINVWVNKASNSITVRQNNEDYRPKFNSVSGVVFSNTNINKVSISGLDTTYFSGNPNETIFILLNNTLSVNNYTLLSPTTGKIKYIYLLSNTTSETILTTAEDGVPGASLLQSGNVTTGTPTLVSTWNSNGNIKHYINGLLRGTSINDPYINGGNTVIGIDDYLSDTRNGFNGSISEIIIYSNALSDSDREKVESYLYWKWDTFVLDKDNPYKTEAYSKYLYPKINPNLIPPVPRNLYTGLPTLDSNNYPLIKNSIRLPNRLKNSMF
jgi:hypothetical protein